MVQVSTSLSSFNNNNNTNTNTNNNNKFLIQLPTLNFALFIYLFIYSWKNMEEVGYIKN